MKKITKLSLVLLSSLTALSILTFSLPSYSSDITSLQEDLIDPEETEGEVNRTSNYALEKPEVEQHDELTFSVDFKFINPDSDLPAPQFLYVLEGSYEGVIRLISNIYDVIIELSDKSSIPIQNLQTCATICACTSTKGEKNCEDISIHMHNVESSSDFDFKSSVYQSIKHTINIFDFGFKHIKWLIFYKGIEESEEEQEIPYLPAV